MPHVHIFVFVSDSNGAICGVPKGRGGVYSVLRVLAGWGHALGRRR